MKRMGRTMGMTASWKKAIVTLTEASKTIEFFDTMLERTWIASTGSKGRQGPRMGYLICPANQNYEE